MKLLLLTVTLSIIFQGIIAQSDAKEDDFGGDNPDENENAEFNSTVTEESDLAGSDSLIKDTVVVAENTTAHFVSENTTRTAKENYPSLGPNECEKPPFIDNAVITSEMLSRYEVGAKVSYKCEFGYITDGAVPSSHCIRSETTEVTYWTKPELSCVPRSCGDPGFVVNAQRIGSVFTFSNKVSYECDEGYKMKGYGSRYCHASGRWSGFPPTCERIFCDPPSDPVNGRVIYFSLGFESELQYECDPGYILRNFQGRSCIGDGTWSGEEPVCQDTQCDPPVPPEFGSVQVIGGKTSVGSRVIYTCDAGRILKGSATSKCLDIGEWTFPTPKCLDPCSVPEVDHGKIGKYVNYGKRFQQIYAGNKVKENEELYLLCENKYEIEGTPKKEEKIYCNGGEWSAIPQCQPAQCRQSPPATANANIGSMNRTHGGGVVYLCKTHFIKEKFGNVFCDFGTWKGVTPVCKDSRCTREALSFQGFILPKKYFYGSGEKLKPSCQKGYYQTMENNTLICEKGTWIGHFPPCTPAPCDLENLFQQEGMETDNKGVVFSGMSVQVTCKKGFSPNGYLAQCSRGEWTIPGKLCKESNCIIYEIINGAFTEAVEKKKWKLLGYDRWTEYEKIGLGITISPGSTVHVTCDEGYSFQGNGWNDVSVKCSSGEWVREPVCLITGTPNNKEPESTSDEQIVGRTKFLNTTKAAAVVTVRPLSIPVPSQTVLKDDLKPELIITVTSDPSCFCTYTNLAEELVAYAGTELLQYGSKVKNNCTVKFHCHHLGYTRLNGPAEIQCRNCQWQPFEFPKCVSPEIGETIYQFISPFKRLPGKIIAIEKGQSLNIMCYSNGINAYPKWSGPKGIARVSISEGIDYHTSQYYTKLIILNSEEQHSGKYQCFNPQYKPADIFIQVIPPEPKCPKLEDDDLLIEYDKGQFVNSSAVFSCIRPNHNVVGSRVLTCLPDGRWSGVKPRCEKQCPEIQEEEGITISYTAGLSIGSIAAFHCFSPRVRSGVSRTTCKQNGEWEDPVPTCALPTCLVDSLFKVVPENVVPDIETVSSEYVPFNSTITLECEDGFRLYGPDKAKCGLNGVWEVSKVQCITGCSYPLSSQDADLIIEPNKKIYRPGELITLSCPQGQVLSDEVVRLLCLNSGWSQDDLPHCIYE